VALALELVAGDSKGRIVADLKERTDELEKARNAIVDSMREGCCILRSEPGASLTVASASHLRGAAHRVPPRLQRLYPKV